jgi:hypothetical protein
MHRTLSDDIADLIIKVRPRASLDLRQSKVGGYPHSADFVIDLMFVTGT